MKLLVSCYACSPFQGSEPGMGWNFVSSLVHFHELHILTEGKFRPDIEKWLEDNEHEKQYYHFYFIDKDRHKLLRKIWPPSYYWFYRDWQKKALQKAQELDKIHNFELIHHLNMVGFRECGYLWKMDKPLVWGPTGGMHISPWCLLPHIGFYGFIYYGLRNLINIWQMHTKTTPKKMAQKCNAIIAATKDAQDAIKSLWNKNAIIIPEVGLSHSSQHIEPTPRNGKLKIVWSGTHTPSKGLNFLLEALAISKHKDNIELHVLGKGVYSERWKKIAKKLELNNTIWYGWVERDKAIQIMKDCHLFCITSMADLTSSVLLESLSYGLPVVAPDCFGFSNTITEDCGIKIPVSNKKQYINDYAHAIDSIFENESHRITLANGALLRAQDFRWEKKAEMIDKIYHDVVASSKK